MMKEEIYLLTPQVIDQVEGSLGHKTTIQISKKIQFSKTKTSHSIKMIFMAVAL
jgi:hypothetical protein